MEKSMHENNCEERKKTGISRCAADRRILRRVFFAENTRRLLRVELFSRKTTEGT